MNKSTYIFRIFDILLSTVGLIALLPIMLLLMVFGLFDTGSPLFFQQRVGRNKKPFILIKFRTMKLETHSVASHLVNVNAITPFGKFLRKTKLDELPQLINIFKGDMSFVGPRPNLFNQSELIFERDKNQLYDFHSK